MARDIILRNELTIELERLPIKKTGEEVSFLYNGLLALTRPTVEINKREYVKLGVNYYDVKTLQGVV